jgi:nucleoside-diphosphate-sugar epimerase
MNILVVGGAGYIGGYLVDVLLSNGYNVTVYDSLLYESRYLKSVQFIYGDVRDRQTLKSILPAYDVVVWLAAVVGDGACAIDPFLSQDINSNTVQWLSRNYDGKVVFTSTCSVYGVNNDLIDEQAAPNPLSVYASTKLEAEQSIKTSVKDHLIFRLGTLYGLGDEHSRVRFDLVVNVLAQKAAAGEPLTVFGGEQWRPLLHVRDVTGAILHGIRNEISGLYNLHESNCRIRDIADEIQKVVPDTKVVYQDIKYEDARNYKVISDAYRSKGWMPKLTLADGINEVYTLIKEKRIRNVRNAVYSNVDYLAGVKSSEWVVR